ncbi:hypothetical protein HG531_012579 [Fusarium graminearum]|nr:hypothetical protein HG531_012579 [Fusarium graminearum]
MENTLNHKPVKDDKDDNHHEVDEEDVGSINEENRRAWAAILANVSYITLEGQGQRVSSEMVEEQKCGLAHGDPEDQEPADGRNEQKRGIEHVPGETPENPAVLSPARGSSKKQAYDGTQSCQRSQPPTKEERPKQIKGVSLVYGLLPILQGEALCLTDIAVRIVMLLEGSLFLILLRGFGGSLGGLVASVIVIFVVRTRLNAGKLGRQTWSATVGLLAHSSIGFYFVNFVVGGEDSAAIGGI